MGLCCIKPPEDADCPTGCGLQSYQNVSRETFWYDQGGKPYKASYAQWLEMRKIARKSHFEAGVSNFAVLLPGETKMVPTGLHFIAWPVAPGGARDTM